MGYWDRSNGAGDPGYSVETFRISFRVARAKFVDQAVRTVRVIGLLWLDEAVSFMKKP